MEVRILNSFFCRDMALICDRVPRSWRDIVLMDLFFLLLVTLVTV
jgi:hypothetical protein